MKKIYVASLLIIMMAWSVASSAQSYNVIKDIIIDNVTYKYGYNGASVISSPKAKGEVTILEKVTFDKREMKVTSISDNAFKGNENITAITLPGTISSIGSNAFLKCKNLKKVNIPESVTSIGSQAFRQTAFEAEDNGLLYVDNWLVGYGFIEKDSPQGDGKKTVMMMEPIGNIAVKEGTTGIAMGAFDYCEQITSLNIPASITNICFPITRGCKSLTTIIVHQDNTKFDSRDNCNAIIDSKNNILWAGCQTTIIPNGVVSIAQKAFDTCTGLTSIVFPPTVKSIGNLAFNNCVNLREFSIPETVTQVQNATFASTGWYKAQPKGLLYKDGWLLGWKSQRPTGQMMVPVGTRHIAGYAFTKCIDLKEVTLPAGLQDIGSEAFWGCEGLKEIVIPEGVKRIGSYAFASCTNLKKINIPASVEEVRLNTVNNTAWFNKQSDGEVYLDGWLLGWKGKKPKGKLTIKNGTKHMAYGSLSYSEITSVVIPPTVTTIGAAAFYNCEKLETVVIPEGVKRIGGQCFYGCEKISDLHIPASVTEVGFNLLHRTAWYDAQPNNELLYLDGWLLGWKGYEVDANKTMINIQPGTRGVAAYTFWWTNGLTSVSIPSSVQYVNEGAFSGCNELIQVKITDLEAWKRITFGNGDSNPTKFSHSLTINGQTITSW